MFFDFGWGNIVPYVLLALIHLNTRTILLAVYRSPGTLASILFLLFFSACTSPLKLLETGEYDRAFYQALDKLAGKSKKKTKWVVVLEEAFARANQRDLRDAEALKREGNPSRSPRIAAIYQDIARRQEALLPLLPLVDDTGRQAEFELVDIDQLLLESRQEAAEYLYARAQQLLRQAEEGVRPAAREAFDLLRQSEDMVPGPYRDRETLIRQAEYLGTTRVLARFVLDAPVLLPADFGEELLAFYLESWHDPWTAFYLEPAHGEEPDIEMVLRLRQARVAPERLRERQRSFERVIEEGTEYLLDKNGNVVKDSLGNDIKVPKKVTIRAEMLEILQQKAAATQLEVAWYDLQADRLIDRFRRDAEAVFEHYSARCRGDRRAIDRELRAYCDKRVVPFPPDATMVFDAAALLRPDLHRSMEAVLGQW